MDDSLEYLDLSHLSFNSDGLSIEEETILKIVRCPFFNHFEAEFNSYMVQRKEGNVLFNDALNTFYLRLYGVGMEGKEKVLFNDAFLTFYLRLYGVRHMVKDH